MERPSRVARRTPSTLPATGAAIGLVVSAVVVGWLFLAPFLSGRATTPFGFDTPHYIWRSNLVIAEGLDSLESMDPLLNSGAQPGRPANPVLSALATHVVGVDPGMLAYVVPAVFAVTIGLAGAGFARGVLDEPAWAMPVYVLILGSSLFVVRTAVGSIDNLMVDPVLIAGAAAALLFAARRRGGAAAVALFVAAFFIHWIFLVLFLLLVLGVGLVLLPSSIRSARAGAGLASTPSARILGVTLGSVVGALGALLLMPGFTADAPALKASGIEAKMSTRIPALRLPVVGGLAAGGAVALWWPKSPLRRSGLLLLGLWALSVPVSLLGYWLFHHHLAAYRVAEFALAIPVLAAAALVGITRLGWSRFRVPGAVAGAALVAIAVVATVAVGSRQWERQSGIMQPSRVQQVATAAAYLNAVHAKGPVVFVVSTPALKPADRVIRAGMPGSLVSSVRVFDGRWEDLLAGHPTAAPGRGKMTASSAASWPAVREVLDDPYIAIFVSSYNRTQGPPPGATPIAPGVWVLKGPVPATAVTPSPAPHPSPWRLASASVLLLLFVGVAGLGWTASLLDAGWLTRAALAPAVGVAAIALATLPFAHLGGPIGPASAWVAYVLIAAGGWIALGAIRLRARSRQP